MGNGRLMGKAIGCILGVMQRTVYLDGTEVYRGNSPDWKRLLENAVVVGVSVRGGEIAYDFRSRS